MVGAREGWVEAPYARVPWAALGTALTRAPASDRRLDVRIVPGLCQSDPPDVMRGEETQIAGYLAEVPDFDGVLCLPGTHTKWAHVSAGEVVSFRTVMTGELFALLSGHSVLRHSLGEGWDDDAFSAAVDETLSRPERLGAALFSLRAAGLLANQSGTVARARLSGLLIGAELAATRPYWLGRPVAVIGAPDLTRHYRSALALQGLDAPERQSADATLSGLVALHRKGP